MESRKDVLETLSGWDTVQLIFKCIFVGLWQIIQISVKKLWKGHRRKLPEDCVPVELTVDSSIGTHCHIKIMGVKYHYVETGPKLGQIVLILKDAPDAGNLWGPNWSNFVQKLAETDHHIITLDLRGTGGSEGGSRSELAPPKAVEELSKLLESLGVSESRRAVVIGFGIGGMLAWYLVHCSGSLVSKFAVIGAPHPNLYWQHPPAAFCRNVLYFIQWPYFPERWLAENEGRCNTTRACDWMGALNYVRGAAWWRIKAGVRTVPPALLVGSKDNANELVDSARHCVNSTLRLVVKPDPSDRELPPILLEFLIVSPKGKTEEAPKSLMGRMLAVAGKGRELTARLILPPTQA